MIATRSSTANYFLEGGSETGDLIRQIDWANHPLGVPANWPQTLKTTLAIILNSSFPMYLFWEGDHYCFYNDAYRHSLGTDGKHPQSLGRPAHEVWPENWQVVSSLLNTVFNEGKSTWYEDELIPINRNGKLEDVYWTFSYSPVLDETGKVVGVFVTCIETTEKVLAARKVEESRAQIKFALDAAELATWDYNLVTGVFSCNERYSSWIGDAEPIVLSNGEASKAIAPDDRNAFSDAYRRALNYDFQDEFDVEFKLSTPNQPERIVRAKGKAWFDEAKKPYRFTGTLQDVTEQTQIRNQIEKSHQTFETLVKQAPVHIAVFRGKDLIAEIANDSYLAVVDKRPEEFLNIPLFESLPETRVVVEPIINELFKTGRPYVTDEIGSWLTRNGQKRYAYFNLVYEPLRDDAGSIDGFIVVANEITQQVIARKKAEDSEAKLQAIVEATPDCIKIVDKDGVLQFMNASGISMLEGDPSLVGKVSVSDVVHPSYRDTWKDNHNRVCNGESLNWEFEIVGLNGTRRFMETHAVPLKGSDGVAQLSVTRDITDRKKSEEVLRYRKAILEAQNEAIPDGILIVDMHGKILSFNQRVVDMWGMPEEIVSRMDDDSALDFVLSKVVDPTAFRKRVEECYANPTENTFDEVTLTDGRIFERRGNPVVGDDGTSYGWAWCFLDVTQQKKAEDEVKSVKNMLHLAFENTPTSIYLLDKNGKIIFANGNGARMMGFRDAKELLSENGLVNLHHTIRKSFELYAEDGVTPYDVTNSPTSKTLRSGIPSEDVIRFVSIADGKNLWVLAETSCMFNEDGAMEMVLTTLTDITHQKEAEQRIRQSEEHFRQLADSMPQIVWTARADGQVDYWNKQWYEFTGQAEGYGDSSWMPILHPDDRERTVEAWHKAVSAGVPYQMEYRFKDRIDGGYRWFLAKGLPIRDESNHVVKWFGTCTDIHHQKTFAEKLGDLVADRTKELARSNEDLQQFAHVASHDLKEPLRKIRTFNNRLITDFANGAFDNIPNYSKKIEHSAARMSSMIDGVLRYSSLEAEQQPDTSVDVNSVCNNILIDLELLINQKQARIDLGSLPVIRGSQTLIQQLFYNLVNNALKFTNPQRLPVITINTQPLKERLPFMRPDLEYSEIVVEDNGIGFDPRHAEDIFKTFSRLHPKDKFEGTGLGLALCKKIALRHDGDIVAESGPGRGATFRVYLPTAKITNQE